jgi:hypothetical protein
MSAAGVIVAWARRAFTLDARSLAAFRIAAGALLLADLATRAGDFAAMYADDGMAPVDLVRSRLGPAQWSLYLVSESDAWQAGLMVLAAVLAAMLTVGYRTRLATIGSWALFASLHSRLPILINAGDSMLRVLLFWSMFLPLGRAWSLDARRSRSLDGDSQPDPSAVFSAASIAFVLQLVLVYVCAGASKLNVDWLQGNALGTILSFRLYGLPAGEWLGQFPQITLWLGRATVALELLGPLLLFIPWRTPLWRMIAVASFLSFHIGIALTMTVGLFAWDGMAAWLAVLPAEFWHRALRRKDRSRQAAQIPPLAAPFEGGRIGAAVIGMLMAMVVAWNVFTFLPRRPQPLAALLRPIGNATMLRQSWHMFARATAYDAWYAYRGVLKNGAVVDLLRGTELLDDEQPAGAQQFANHRWRKAHTRLSQESNSAYRLPLAEYVCRQWNATHGPDEQVARLDFYCIRRRIDDDGASGGYVRVNLAQIVADPSQGNFAEALRELEAGGF